MDARVVDGDTRAALETARFADRGSCSGLFGFSTLAARTLFSQPRDTRRFATAATDARGVSDARRGRGARLDTQTRRPALKTRVSASACTELRGNAARSRFADPSRTRRSRDEPSNRQSGSNFARCVFAALPAPLRGDDAASKRPFGRARRWRANVRHPNSPSRARTARFRLGVH